METQVAAPKNTPQVEQHPAQRKFSKNHFHILFITKALKIYPMLRPSLIGGPANRF